MGMRPRFTPADVRADMEKRLQAIDTAIINRLSYLGELCVNHARSVNTYRDQTGNLRSSIGYVLVKDGRVIKRNFTGTGSGPAEGEGLAGTLVGQYRSGYALIVVAGMNYATKVESRGLDVLSTAEQLAERELPGMLRALKADIAGMH